MATNVSESAIRYNNSKRLRAAVLIGLMFGAAVPLETATSARAEDAGDKLMNESDAGDRSFNPDDYATSESQVSTCNTELEDLTTSPTYGPYEYSCRTTRLSRLPTSGIFKFIAFACRNGFNERTARHKASAADQQMLFGMQLAAAKQWGQSNQTFSMVREIMRCAPGRSVPPASPSASPPGPNKSSVPPSSKEHPNVAKFVFHARDRYPLSAKFYSQGRDIVWPGRNQHYNLTGDQTFNLACNPGETICYGVYRENQSVSWGAGRNGLDHCTKQCCIACGGELEAGFRDNRSDTGPPPATFILHNRDRYTLGVEFYSQTRRNHVWPGGSQQYKLSRDQYYPLRCQVGEQICFGAWRDHQTKYWGVGRNNKFRCKRCCVICGQTFETTLLDAGPDSFRSRKTVAGGGENSGGGGSGGINDTINTVSDLLSVATTILGSGVLNGGSAPTYRGVPRRQESDITGTRR